MYNKSKPSLAENIMVREKTCRTALNKTSIPGYRYCLNPYTGCMHKCSYCYASFMSRFTGYSEPWGDFVDVKVNFARVLKKQLDRGQIKEGVILLGTVTDPYQPLEAEYRLTRSSLEVLSAHPSLGVEILTKSSLVVRDIEVLGKLSRCSVGFTITTVDEKAAGYLEPGAAPPGLRLAAARQLIEAGIPVWVFVAPLLPGVGDTGGALSGLFSALHRAGVHEVMVDRLNPYPSVLHRLKNSYRRYFPEALPELEQYLNNPQVYLLIAAGRVKELSRQHGLEPAFI